MVGLDDLRGLFQPMTPSLNTWVTELKVTSSAPVRILGPCIDHSIFSCFVLILSLCRTNSAGVSEIASKQNTSLLNFQILPCVIQDS